jgi:uncharacterized membrane protein YfcA
MTNLLALAAGLAAGLLSGVFGIGGGIVLVPLLGLLLGLGQLDAQGMTLAVLLLPIGLPAVLAYRKRVAIPWRLVAAVIAGFVAAVGPGARLATSMDPRHLRAAFAVLVVAAAVQMWRRAATRASPRSGTAGEARSSWNGLWIGAVGGFLAGLLGIGGGLVMIPLLVAAMRLDQHEAQAVSLAVMLPPVGLPGVLTYAHARGPLPWVILALVATGFAAGALGGARVAVGIRTANLSRAFALFLLAVAARLAWTSLRG